MPRPPRPAFPAAPGPAPDSTPARVLGSALGGVLAVLANAPALVPRRQPLHERGETRDAVWRVHTPWPESGVEVLASAGRPPC